MNPSSRNWSFIDVTLPWLILGVLVVFIYVMFFQTPYVGFDFNPSNGEIIELFVQVQGEESLAVGDHLTQVGQLSWSTYRENPYLPLFDNTQTVDEITLVVQRGDREKVILWKLPEPTYLEIINRLFNIWWLGLIFWIIGTISTLFIRPRDTRWWLFVGFNYLTAIWLVVGNWSRWQVWGNAVFFASVLWLCIPVYLHLHWVFPKPFRQIPRWLLGGVYSVSLLLAFSEWFLLLPRGMYYFGFLLATGGSVVSLMLHYLLQSTLRRDVGLLFVALVLAIAPSIILGVLYVFGTIPNIGGGSLLALPILPVAYFYSIYRRRFGGLEARANRIIAAYGFFILMGVAVVLITVVRRWLFPSDDMVIAGLIVALIVPISTAIGYPRFIRWFEFHLLGIKLPPEQLVNIYGNRITRSLSKKKLGSLIQDELLPSLLVRQSALMQVDHDNNLTAIYAHHVENDQLPGYREILKWIELGNRYLHPSTHQHLPWVRLCLPLQVESEVRGLWLLGRRDPDDYYSQTEIEVLKTIANQTAIALVNIEQAERLSALYQANIERHEQERTNLARDLHDDVLNQLAAFSMQVDQEIAPDVEEGFATITTRLRQMISGLRPAMLSYGLAPALEELVDELSVRSENNAIQININSSGARYESGVETHLYRIVQQACENALRHAQARTIEIYGSCDSEEVQLTIADAGVGFPKPDHLDFKQLLADKHYGVAGMFERAEIIGAELRIDSKPGEGTRVNLSWNSPTQAG